MTKEIKKKTNIEKIVDDDTKSKMAVFYKELETKFNHPIEDADKYEINLYTTGILNLDDALGGGLPVGMFTELWGEEQSGKTLISLLAIAEMQKSGKPCMYIDAEFRFNPKWAKVLGVNTDSSMLTFIRKNTVQEVFEIIKKAALTKIYGLIVLDSIGALTTLSATQMNMVNDSFKVGGIAGVLTECSRLVVAPLAETGTSLIVINQQRDTIGVNYGPPQKHSSGGNFLKHAGSIRIRVYKPSQSKILWEDDKAKGVEIRCAIEKSSIGANYREASFRLDYETGLDREYDLVSLLEDKGVITKSGSFYTFEDIKFQGFDNMLREVRSNNNLKKRMIDKAEHLLGRKIELMNEKGTSHENK